ncbi:MAG: nucleoside transporter [Nitrospinae bacterium]|nr:nucleoside transporter [Nitrospinota bacterium]
MELYNLVSFFGIFIILLISWGFSHNRKVINWNVIGYGLAIEMLFALFIFVLPEGAKFFEFINTVVVKVLDSAKAGTEFLFGRLALSPGAVNAQGETSLGFILAIQALPTIIFFAALVQILYYYRVLPFIIKKFAFFFTKFMKVSGAESLCVSSNIFVGIEASLTIRPHLKNFTKSEFFTILTAGMATIASSMLALYVYILHQEFPQIAGHLVSASILSAPAALIISKLMFPETELPKTLGVNIDPDYEKESNVIESTVNGANSGLKLLLGIMALLLAFLGIIALIDLIISFPGGWINELLRTNIDWSLKALFGYLFYPLTLIIGVPLEDAFAISKIIGERLVATEVQSYIDLKLLIASGQELSPRSIVICTYALCGFAHFASLAIFVGGIVAIVPERTKDITALGLKALVAATFACLLTASIAGTFFNNASILIQ